MQLDIQKIYSLMAAKRWKAQDVSRRMRRSASYFPVVIYNTKKGKAVQPRIAGDVAKAFGVSVEEITITPLPQQDKAA
jgi:hypothetical protein